MTIQNIRGLVRSLKKHQKKKMAAFKRGLGKSGLLLQRFSQEIVPTDLVILKPSAKTRFDKITPTYISVVVSYGTYYAVYVHENLTANHPKPGQRAKFLEEPARTKRKELIQVVVDEVAK